MLALLSFILSCYGLTMIVVYSKILESARKKLESFNSELLSYIIKCTMCTGFWVGMFNWFLFDVDFGLFSAGFISAGTSYILSKLFTEDGIAVNFKSK